MHVGRQRDGVLKTTNVIELNDVNDEFMLLKTLRRTWPRYFRK